MGWKCQGGESDGGRKERGNGRLTFKLMCGAKLFERQTRGFVASPGPQMAPPSFLFINTRVPPVNQHLV